ncbi:MAG: Rne/Rng family ribonuclease [Muribaculaceae bacterium]|nr:Rne/Rng family ribonuclease [Muribaculaceae bacterium]
MKSELFVDVQQKEISIALLEDSRLVSLQKESRSEVYSVGDFYLAKVKKLMPGLNAAFVDVGYDKDAFLHYLDLGPQFSTYSSFINQALESPESVPEIANCKVLPDIPKQGTISDLLQPGQRLLVQIAKEPISTKGPRLTTELSITGRFMVLIPFGNKISISQKIKSTEEKIRLRQLITSIKPKGFGIIVRTSAEGKKVAELINEMRTLVEAWQNAIAKMQRSTPPSLIYEEESRAVSVIRDIFNPSFESVYVNDAEVFEQIQNYISLIAPENKESVKLYSKDIPIFDHFNITRQIKSAFGKTVSFKSGAYLIIEHTEALHVIDVNSGNRSKASQDQETNALEVNLRAADEIARQLRLRDMGGIIVVDFIDMAKAEHRQQLLEHMRDNMSKDRARHNILPLSKFGLMQITRQRVRPALDITTEESCPCCFGKGVVQPSLLFTDKLEEKLVYLTDHLDIKKFTLFVHPFVDAYVKKGMFSIYGKWRRRFGRGLKVVPDEALAYLQYKVIDNSGKEVFLQEESDMNSAQSKNKTRSDRSADEDSSASDQ